MADMRCCALVDTTMSTGMPLFTFGSRTRWKGIGDTAETIFPSWVECAPPIGMMTDSSRWHVSSSRMCGMSVTDHKILAAPSDWLTTQSL
ncbi:hypothetical protein WG66_008899 [Moniliophthora roreri]|nr:hypothetical protein WG66_008899 [Moniliophthora roreri]